MHELTLAESIVSSILRTPGVEANRVRAVAVEVGALAAVNVDSLEFCLRAVLDERGMPQAQAQITSAPAVLRCKCGERFETPDAFAPCPSCGGFEREIQAGTDVTVLHVEVDDEEGEDRPVGSGE